MNSLFNKHRWMQVMWGILLFVAGAITIIFAVTNEGANVSLALSVAIAVILFAYGLTIAFSSFLELKDRFFKFEIIIGALIIAVGIVFCLNIDLIKGILVDTISAALLAFGAAFTTRAIIAYVRKLKVWWKPLCIVFATLFLAAGVLCLIFKANVVDACFIVLGVILILVGIFEVYMSIKRAIEASKQAIEQKEVPQEDNAEEIIENQIEQKE